MAIDMLAAAPMASRLALITGATGQDGRLMTRLLKARGYDVVGTSRHAPLGGLGPEGCPLVRCSLTDQDEVSAIIERWRPEEVYNFAAFSTGSGMFDDPLAMADVNGQGPVRLMEAIRQISPRTRFCQASSAEMFGARSPHPQSADTRLDPRSPYGAAKQFAHVMVDVYRKRYGLFACSAILFNHESPLRPTTFVTRKIARAAARIHVGRDSFVTLGNLESRRDWGYAGDYMEAAWRMLQAERPRDYVIASGQTHSVADVARIAFQAVSLDYRDYLRSDPTLNRPSADVTLVGDPTAIRELGWNPTVSFEEMITMMVLADLQSIDLN